MIKGSARNVVYAIVVGVFALVYTWLYYDRGLDQFDVGLFATEAERAAQGGVYGEDFLAPYGPGRYYLIGFLFKVFGPTLKTQAVLWLVMRGLIAVLLFKASRAFLPTWLAILAAVVVTLAPGALHKGFFQAGVLIVLLSWLAYRRKPSFMSCAISGATIAMVSLFRVDIGVFGWCSFLLLIWIETSWNIPRLAVSSALARTVALIVGAALIISPIVIWLWIKSDLALIVKAEIHRTLNVSSFADYLKIPGFNEGIRPFLFASMIRSGPVIFVLLAIAAIVRRVGRGYQSESLTPLALVVIGAPVLNQVRITPTFNHFLHALPLVLLAALTLILFIKEIRFFKLIKMRIVRQSIVIFLVLIPCSIPVYFNFAYARGVFPASIRNIWDFTEQVKLDKAGIFESPGAARGLEKIVKYIKMNTQPDEAVFVDPFSPVLNFLADRPPAVRFLEPFYYFGNQELQQIVIDDMIKTNPSLIILDPLTRVGRQRLKDDAPTVYSYIRQNYTRVGMRERVMKNYQIWIKP